MKAWMGEAIVLAVIAVSIATCNIVEAVNRGPAERCAVSCDEQHQRMESYEKTSTGEACKCLPR